MKSGRIIVIGVAAVAAGLAGVGVIGLIPGNKTAEIVEVQRDSPQLKLEEVLVASETIGVGRNINSSMLKWQDWPAEGLAPGYITRSTNPDAMETVSKAIARSNFLEGEPIRDSKLVRSDRGYMSAILPAGQRAIATNISTATSAGGFILPNDHVDVIMTRRNGEAFITETVLENVRVLAIDQAIEEKDGQSVVVGETATLQLSPEQSQILVVAQQMADRLTLSLRSLEDSKDNSTKGADYLLSGTRGNGRVKTIKYGISKELVIGAQDNDPQLTSGSVGQGADSAASPSE